MRRFFGVVVLTTFIISSIISSSAFAEESELPRFISVSHNEKTGRTTIKWQDIRSGAPLFYNIYRYSEPINIENIFFASLIAGKVPSGTGECIYTINESGLSYYAITVSTQSGKETRIFGLENSSGPIKEVDRTPPRPVVIEISFKNSSPVISWQTPSADNPEGITSYNVYRKPKSIGKNEKFHLQGKIFLESQLDKIAFTDKAFSKKEGIFYYVVTALDGSGNESLLSNIVTAGLLPELSVSQENLIARNKDIKISKMYPVVGERVKFESKIHNRGAIPATDVTVRVTVSPKKGKEVGKEIFQTTISHITENTSSVVSFEWLPERKGIYEIKIGVDPKGKIVELNKTDNEVSIEVAVGTRDTYFLWYGGNPDFSYANVLYTDKSGIDEWKRRGALACAPSGAGFDLPNYLGLAEAEYSGTVYDEIGGMDEKLIRNFTELKKKYPNFFVGVWQVGYTPAKETVELVKNGKIDLLILEIYLDVGMPLKYVEDAIVSVRELGISSRVIIGLASDAGWAKWKTAEEQASFLEEEIKFIREKAPEMPGVGFFTDHTLPGVRQKVDRMCYDYFFGE